MNDNQRFSYVSFATSKLISNTYSTSFSLGMRFIDKRCRNAVYAVYGFVRIADEVVDSLFAYNQVQLLEKFKEDTYLAIEEGVSCNPVLNSFQEIVNRYAIELELIEAFFRSMENDLVRRKLDELEYQEYIYGSAEVVGLMCLRIFTKGQKEMYTQLSPYAKKLGSAFQKVNFLRDVKSDFEERGRIYFPEINNLQQAERAEKTRIELSIAEDFKMAKQGIQALPQEVKLGVYIAYIYYVRLFKKIESKSMADLLKGRIRIPNFEKLFLLLSCVLKFKLRKI